MATWTDKDIFKLIRDDRDSSFHAIRPAVLNDLFQYCSCFDVVPIRTNGEIITTWSSNNYIATQPINRTSLAEMIKNTKPKEAMPVLVVSIPEIERADIGMVAYCWMYLNSAKTMQMYRTNGTTKSLEVFNIPEQDKDTVKGFSENCVIRSIGTPRIYYDWREALAPIRIYLKEVIKYCKDTGKERRLKAEVAAKALNDRTKTIRTLVSKNDKRFGSITF